MLFIDEIHRLNPAVEEILYPAMEDFQLDLIIGEGPAARSVKIDLAKFTLVGATTRAGLLTNPLRDRFGIPVRLNFYTEAELEQIVNRGARVLGIGIDRGRRQRDRAARRAARRASPGGCCAACATSPSVAGAAAIDRARRRHGARRARSRRRRPRRHGPALSRHDRASTYGGGPVGVETLAAALSEPRDAIEDIIEPYLIQCGLFAAHAARPGADATRSAIWAWRSRRAPAQFGLFGGDGED